MYILVKQKVKRVKRFYIKKNHDTIFFNVIQYNKFFLHLHLLLHSRYTVRDIPFVNTGKFGHEMN